STLNRVPILNVFNPVYGNIDVAAMQGYINAASNNVLYRQHFRDTGVYVQDEISFNERLFVLMGGRYDIARDSASQVYGAVSSACFPT
ncbi:TonB-dependent receptor, partial [Acinetobacter baumannii]